MTSARHGQEGPSEAVRRQRDGIEITDDHMTAVYGGQVIATAWYSQSAGADGNAAWIVSTHAARLFGHNDAITALTLAERLAAGYCDDDPFVKSWRAELEAARKADSGSAR
jgi:hypothetical protein